MKNNPLITDEKLQRVREKFLMDGQSIQEWARENNFPPHLVYAVVSGRSKAQRGQSHRVAVQLGLIGATDINISDTFEKEAAPH